MFARPFLGLLLSCCALIDCRSCSASATPDFETQIAPLLIKRCVECHQGSHPAGNLLLTTNDGLQAGGDSGSVLDEKAPAESYLLDRVHAAEMPPPEKGLERKLPAAEIKLLEQWISAGAKWPQDRTLDWFEQTNDLRAGRDWWSLQPIVRPEVPTLKSSTSENPIDAFILARLEANGMVAAPRPDKRTLLRRLYYDLIGLPPSYEQLEAFAADGSPDAWEGVIDALLASPRYGERWGRYWLDLVRYADTSGYERDQEKPFAWKYRDWVLAAFNNDLPYDQFILAQLAGDELPDRDEQSVIATGFLRLGTWNDEPNDPLDYQYERLEDLVHTTSSAFLGLTVKCARCHNHKFDPITQEDYHRMASVFWAGPIAARDRALLGGPSAEELGFEEILGWTDLAAKPAPLHLLKNGEREHPLQEVIPASLSFLPELEQPFEVSAESAKTSQRRLQLAKWIADPRNPLTPRVLINRLWQHHFGEGIVRSPNNFGFLADPPTHRELLDWLAAEFLDGGMTLKRMHKLILLSQTWQQSSLHPLAEQYRATDAGNRLWWRAERQRLDAESLRDSLLATTGELDLKMGGPGFRPTINAEALEGLSMKSAAWKESPPEEQLRRTVYVYSKRGLLPPLLTTFDLCDPTSSCGQRDSTTLPTQALTLLNNRFIHARSGQLAEKVSEISSQQEMQVAELWRRIYGRDPSTEELQLGLQHLKTQQSHFEKQQTQQVTAAENESAKLVESLQKACVLHLRADSSVSTDAIQRTFLWKDLSGHGHHAVQKEESQQPKLKVAAINGHPAMSFDGESRFMKLRRIPLEQQNCTIIAVASDRGTLGHREIISNWDGSQGNAGTSLFLGLTDENRVRFSDDFSNAGTITNREEPFVLTAVSGESFAAVYQNGQIIGQRETPLSPRNLTTEWVIGQQGNINGEYWHGDIAEIRVYAKALNDAERTLIEQQLAEWYDIAVKKQQVSAPVSSKQRALASLAHVLLNSNEFLYVD